MLRTIVGRNAVVRSGLKKVVRANVVRCISTEVARRKQNRLLNPSIKKSLPGSQWVIQFRLYSDLPSHIKVNLPALSPTMETGTIISWEKKEGDQLNEGDLLCEIETDKATMGFETPEEGFLAKILIPTGSKGIPVGKLICVICDNKDDVASFKDFKDDSPSEPQPKKPKKKEDDSEKASSEAPAAQEASSPPPAAASPPPAQAAQEKAGDITSSRVYASPMAKRLAELKNKRLQGKGSGLYGSLKSGDVAGMSGEESRAPSEEAKSAPVTAGASYTDVPLSSMRATIAKRLSQAKQTIPHYQLSMTCNIDKLMLVRKDVNDMLEKEKMGVKVSVNDFIIKAVASSCKRVPSVNAHWMETFIRQFSNVDVSVAVATPAGLITPIIMNADSRGIIDISRTMKELANKAKDNKLRPEEYQGGTVTVSNLGMFGITMFNAIINPPQSLILACGGPQELMVPDNTKLEGWRMGKFITITASADHRVIDGAVGAEWMKVLKSNLEEPAYSLL